VTISSAHIGSDEVGAALFTVPVRNDLPEPLLITTSGMVMEDTGRKRQAEEPVTV
jgi:hypothetical protein